MFINYIYSINCLLTETSDAGSSPPVANTVFFSMIINAKI